MVCKLGVWEDRGCGCCCKVVVAAAKLWWQAKVELLDLDSLFSVACKLRSGVGQQPLRALLYT